jgi:hypothetical protein
MRPCWTRLIGPISGREWRLQAHMTLADTYSMRVVGTREDNIEHVIHHLTKALANVSIEGPASKTDRFGKGPLNGHALTWSEVMTKLGSAYSERVKVSFFMVKSVCVFVGVLPLSV